MDKKTKIETALMFINNGVYNINEVIILGDDFEIINDNMLKFYMYINAYGKKLRYTVAMIPLNDIHSIDGFEV